MTNRSIALAGVFEQEKRKVKQNLRAFHRAFSCPALKLFFLWADSKNCGARFSFSWKRSINDCYKWELILNGD